MGKVDGNVVVGCATALIFSLIVFGSLTLNASWNMTAKCRHEAQKVADKTVADWEAKHAPR